MMKQWRPVYLDTMSSQLDEENDLDEWKRLETLENKYLGMESIHNDRKLP